MSAYATGLIGILIALGLLIFLAFRGYTLLLAAPAAAIVAAAFSREPILAKWTLTFMQGTGGFIANFFPLFLLGGVFGKCWGSYSGHFEHCFPLSSHVILRSGHRPRVASSCAAASMQANVVNSSGALGW
jgi:hypothetical protein